MTTLAMLLGLMVLIPTPVDVLILQFPAKSKVSLPLGGKSKADIQRLATTTKAVIKVEGLQSPQSVRAGMNTYVAWAVSPEGSFDNLGELEIVGAKGSLEATTPFDRFALLITAEPHYLVDKPSSQIVFRNEEPRNLSGVTIKIEVGSYEYGSLPGSTDTVPTLVLEARAAFAIAAAVQMDSQDSEYRQARVALDTMEELIRRASANDVVSAAAHAAIRRSQRAAVAARQSPQ